MRLPVEQIKQLFPFQPIPVEGGLSYQTYISIDRIQISALPDRYSPALKEKALNSVIYFLLEDTPDCFSALHRLTSDETYHFYMGDPVELLLLYENGESEVITLGQDLFHGQKIQYTVPQGVWQGSRILPGGEYAFMAASMSPGFDQADFTRGEREALIRQYPARAAMIRDLTRP